MCDVCNKQCDNSFCNMDRCTITGYLKRVCLCKQCIAEKSKLKGVMD